jgi:hypothetical protein
MPYIVNFKMVDVDGDGKITADGELELSGNGAQGRSTPSLLNQRLSEKWDTSSSHMIIMLSGASVPPPST